MIHVGRGFRRFLVQPPSQNRVSSELVLFRIYPVRTCKPPRVKIAQQLWKVWSSAWLASWWNNMKLGSDKLLLDNTISKLKWWCFSRERLSPFPFCKWPLCFFSSLWMQEQRAVWRRILRDRTMFLWNRMDWPAVWNQARSLPALTRLCPGSHGLKVLAVHQKVSIDKR